MEGGMAKSDHAAARRAVALLTRQIDAQARELRKERSKANARRKAAINLRLRKLSKTRACVLMAGWGTACVITK